MLVNGREIFSGSLHPTVTASACTSEELFPHAYNIPVQWNDCWLQPRMSNFGVPYTLVAEQRSAQWRFERVSLHRNLLQRHLLVNFVTKFEVADKLLDYRRVQQTADFCRIQSFLELTIKDNWDPDSSIWKGLGRVKDKKKWCGLHRRNWGKQKVQKSVRWIWRL